jgi:hypothetical protein
VIGAPTPVPSRPSDAEREWALRANGTRLNGWRVAEEVELRPGDRVSFGAARYRVGDGR